MKKYEKENVFLSKVPFNTAMLVIALVAGFFSVWIGQEKVVMQSQYASLALGSSSMGSVAMNAYACGFLCSAFTTCG